MSNEMCASLPKITGTWVERTVVDFQQRAVLFGGKHKRFEMELCRPVARMADDVDIRITDGAQYGVGVLVDGSGRVAEGMQAGDADVQPFEVSFFQVDGPLIVQDVQLRTEQQFHAIHAARHDVQVSEVNRGACARQAGGVFGDAQEL